MIETVDRLYALLSGSRLTSKSATSPEIGHKVKEGLLAGVTIIAGVDAAGTGTLPGDCWPRIVIEPVREESVNVLFKQVTLLLDVGVKIPGRFSALLAVMRLAKDVRHILLQNQRLEIDGTTYAANCVITDTRYELGGSDKGNTVGRRFAVITAQYTVPTKERI